MHTCSQLHKVVSATKWFKVICSGTNGMVKENGLDTLVVHLPQIEPIHTMTTFDEDAPPNGMWCLCNMSILNM